jgi:low temperature requirement protein LtrA
MRARSISEEHRSATPLELFFDLCFVVAVAQAADRLHHALVEDHLATGVVSYAMVFFAIWWAWMNFTWFASAYDCDDVPYRLATFVQITGVLILAAGLPRAFDDRDFTVVTLGYAVMRLALVAQWLRATDSDPARRATATRFAVGVSGCTLGWGVLLLLPDAIRLPMFLVMVAAELGVPVWAERPARTTWHPHHIAERYGLFTLIVLGESVLSTTIAIQSVLDEDAGAAGLAGILVGAPLIVFAMWWLYFAKPAYVLLRSNSRAFVWGYGHLLIFASAAAVGAGLATAVDGAAGRAHLSAATAGSAVTVPVAIYLLVLWALHLRPHHRGRAVSALVPGAVVLVLGSTASGQPVLVTGLVLAVLVGVSVFLSSEGTNNAER